MPRRGAIAGNQIGAPKPYHFSPLPKIWPPQLPLYDRCVLVRYVSVQEYADPVHKGDWNAVGSKRRIQALHVVYRDRRELRADHVPTGQRMHYLEPVGDHQVWQHRHVALSWPQYRAVSSVVPL